MICVQIGAREHYAVARALHRRQALAALVTDVWASAGGLIGKASRRLADRYQSEIATARVISANFSAMSHELSARWRGAPDWDRIMARNAWFGQMAVRRIEKLGFDDRQVSVFAYSYAARSVFAYARRRGWRAVLGQIDPGPVEEKLVAAEFSRYPGIARHWRPAPSPYWQLWRDEIDLADRVVVNSHWSRDALLSEGVSASRMDIVPLAFDPPSEALGFRRMYPQNFDLKRPLRVLFLGQVNLRKGLGPLIDSIPLVDDLPVEFHIAGPVQIAPPDELDLGARVIWHGPIARSGVDTLYRAADVFLLPTISDGFALTQLEARAWRLPLIVTPQCGRVIEDDVTGIVIEPGNPAAIATAIRHCVNSPEWLQAASDSIAPGEQFGIDQLGEVLISL